VRRGDIQRSTFLELFFDLVFVLALTQLSQTLVDHLNWSGAYRTLILIMAVVDVGHHHMGADPAARGHRGHGRDPDGHPAAQPPPLAGETVPRADAGAGSASVRRPRRSRRCVAPPCAVLEFRPRAGRALDSSCPSKWRQ
jgi:hypothetical protein